MLMPKKTRVAIYEYLFTEGVVVAEKNFEIQHPHIKVSNLHVVKALQTLQSKGLVKESYAWRHHYWYLTNEGIQYLRDFLHLPPEIVPATLKRPAKAETARTKRPETGKPEGGAQEGDRQNYRRGPAGGDKKAEAGAGSSEVKTSGFGRGKKPTTE